MRNRSEKDLLDVFTRNYEIALRRVANGEELKNPIPLGLPEKVEVLSSRADNQKNLKALMAGL